MTQTTTMRVRLYDDTGAMEWAGPWADFSAANPDLDVADREELFRVGRVWLGGGAAPLMLVTCSHG